MHRPGTGLTSTTEGGTQVRVPGLGPFEWPSIELEGIRSGSLASCCLIGWLTYDFSVPGFWSLRH